MTGNWKGESGWETVSSYLADVQPGPLASLRPVDVTQRPKTEPVAAAGVDISVNNDGPPTARNLEDLSHLTTIFVAISILDIS